MPVSVVVYIFIALTAVSSKVVSCCFVTDFFLAHYAYYSIILVARGN